MQYRSVKRALFLLLVVCVGSVLSAWAQSASTGTVAGEVNDQTGAIVQGATVTLTDVSTNNSRTDTTNAAGRYIFVDVTSGIYNIAISKAGFSTTKTEHLQVTVGSALTVNLSLQVGGSSTVVEVTAVGTELQTMNATVGNTVTSVAIDNLPSLGRDVSTFVTLQPGVGTDGSVAGAYQDQNYFSLDGGNNTNDLDGSGSVYTPSMGVSDPTGGVAGQMFGVSGASGVMPTPQDSVEEFKVNTSNQTADFSSSAGAEVKVVTKRGSNAWHGTGYKYYKDNNWSSNSYQNNLFAVPIPSFHYNRFGGAIGGPVIPKEIFGGKTFVFFNYEGFHWPDSQTINRNVPSPSLEAGNITDPHTGTVYSLASIDPLGLGLNPLVSQIWNKYEPTSNTGTNCPSGQTLCDGVNVLGFSGNLSLPTTSKIAVARIDHDFSAKEHFMTSWRYYNIKQASSSQVDTGGYFSGDALGVPASISSDPIQDWYLVAGLTSNITNNVTNDVHYSWLRNWWAWARNGAPPQNCTLCTGLGGALEIESGEGAGAAQDLAPYNVNNQQIRTRFWDGHDQMLRDDLSMLHGNHLFQLGAMYQRNWNWHQRNDGGGFINEFPVYSVGDGTAGSGLATGSDLAICSLQYIPAGSTTPVKDIPNCGALTAAALGIVSVANQAFTRSGANLSLNPPLAPAFDKSTIPYYNFYFSDTWHLKPTFTLTYGLSWSLEMPPTEANGKQVVMVDDADEPITTRAYLAARERNALAGQAYNPEVGFALTGNVANGEKYPYNPYYGQFGPRVAAAWNPRFDNDTFAGKIFGHEDTVIRGGYGRSYGRLNGVTQVLIPLLGLGLIQQQQCVQNLGLGGAACGPGAGTLYNAFRVGPSSLSAVSGLVAPIPVPSATLPQPVYPGYNSGSTATASILDPNFRPDSIDSFDLTVQRQLSRKLNLEVGYIGRRFKNEFQPMLLNTVPYMMTQGGQQFKQAYANTVLQYCGGVTGLGGGGCAANAAAVTPQPFFETALAGTGYCNGFASCTAAVVANEAGNLANAQVWSLWSDLDAGAGCPAGGCTSVNGGSGAFAFPRTMMNTPIPGQPNGGSGQVSSGIQSDASTGWSNYNGGFVSLRMADWRGLTAQSNFTFSKALGTGAIYQAVSAYGSFDSFNLGEEYGRQAFDQKYTFNMFFVYQPPFYKGQAGAIGRVLGGWTFATVFTAGSGTPVNNETTYGSAQEFGSADDINFGTDANALPIKPEGHLVAHYNSPSNGLPVNGYKNGIADASNWRNPILGLDNKDCGFGCISGLNYWNTDFSIKKSVLITEGINLEFQGVFANIFNHDQMLNGFSYLGNPGGWGALGGSAQEQTGGNRIVELGARVKF
jgi:hypothetical protein